MTPHPDVSFGRPDLDAFLFAPVGVDNAGLPLTVLSALTRLGFDPWGEAARLSSLSVGAATDALAKTLARLPEGDWKKSDSASIAIRLIASLPRRGALAQPPTPDRRGATIGMPSLSKAALWLFCLVAAVGCYMLLSQLTAPSAFEPPTAVTTRG